MDRPRLRPVDLARTVGVSTQQIRNYVDMGVLPPAERTPAGHRVFDARHRNALLTYRALAKGYGWDTARSIMRAAHDDDLPRALALIDASHAALHEERLSLQALGEALEEVVAHGPETSIGTRSDMRIGEVAALIGVRASALRVWEAAELLTPHREPGSAYRSYGPADVRDARMISMMRRGRHPLPQIRAVLDGLRRTGSKDALQAAIAERRDILTRTAADMLNGTGHLSRYLADGVPR